MKMRRETYAFAANEIKMKTEIIEKLNEHAELLLSKKYIPSIDARFLLEYLHKIEIDENRADMRRKYANLIERGLY